MQCYGNVKRGEAKERMKEREEAGRYNEREGGNEGAQGSIYAAVLNGG